MKTALLVLGGYLAATPATPSTKPAQQPCPEEKINFTKETGCQNDGYVQFCIPEGNKKVRAAVKRIAPTAEKKNGQNCGEKQALYFLPVPAESKSCVERGGAMTDKAWNQVCALARLPQIAGIRQVRFE